MAQCASIRAVGRDIEATLADQLSLLPDATGYRAMLRQSKAETTEDRVGNLQEPIQLPGASTPHRNCSTTPLSRPAGPARTILSACA